MPYLLWLQVVNRMRIWSNYRIRPRREKPQGKLLLPLLLPAQDNISCTLLLSAIPGPTCRSCTISCMMPGGRGRTCCFCRQLKLTKCGEPLSCTTPVMPEGSWPIESFKQVSTTLHISVTAELVCLQNWSVAALRPWLPLVVQPFLVCGLCREVFPQILAGCQWLVTVVTVVTVVTRPVLGSRQTLATPCTVPTVVAMVTV